jgi:hypothetical protein
MRYLYLPLIAILALATPSLAPGQPPSVARINKVRVGFKPYNENINFGRYKAGLWVPVYVEVEAGQNGLGGDRRPYLHIETPDFEGVGTIYRTPVVVGPNDIEVFTGYTKAGNTGGDMKVELHVGNRRFQAPPERFMAMDLHGYVYLTLGRRVADLPAALRPKDDKNQQQNNAQFQDDTNFRVALFEDNVDLLPRHWFGYDGVDMIFLSADNKEFLVKLADQGHVDHLKALAQWVRRGGRLVIPMSKQTQELAANLLNRGAWQPPVPVVPPSQTAEKFVQPPQLEAVQHWAEVQVPLPNPGEKPPLIAQLAPPGPGPLDWDIEARVGAEGPPLIARVRYGMGQIIYFAFSLDDVAFSQWPGRQDFLRKAVAKLAPRGGQDNQQNMGGRRFGRAAPDSTDTTSQIYNALDNFDVHVIPFGIVAVFIFLYVIVVGPLEFILLKYVFGRLEWTWITFPAVVIGVSVIAYFSAFALKGQELKINKVDVVDFDLRTDQRQPRQVRVFGQTFLMVLSPQIKSYTVGIEPNPSFWGDEKPAKPLSADVVSWMARADQDDFGGMGRGGGQGFFRKPYYYGGAVKGQALDDPPLDETLPSGVSGVPIPVWMSKAFGASWETTANVPPVVADLTFHRFPVEGKDLKVSGSLKSNLAVDLVDTWLIYADRAYPIEGGVPAKKEGGQPLKLALESRDSKVMSEWFGLGGAGSRPTTSQGTYDPTPFVKQMLFHEYFDKTRSLSNHSLRRLDLSWRLYEEPPQVVGVVDKRLREAILVGRVALRDGKAETLVGDINEPLPTRLWLGGLPESGDPRDPLNGTLNQDTFVRVILPVKAPGN